MQLSLSFAQSDQLIVFSNAQLDIAMLNLGVDRIYDPSFKRYLLPTLNGINVEHMQICLVHMCTKHRPFIFICYVLTV